MSNSVKMSTKTNNITSLERIQSEISRLITKHEPEKVEDVDNVLQKWEGRETEALKILCQYYNEEFPNIQSVRVKHTYSIQTITDYEEELRHNLLHKLMDHTELSKDICNEIISYLPLQTQHIKLHTIIQNASIYSIMQFVVLIINNIVHYIICVLFINILHIMIPFAIFSVAETILLLYFFNAFYRHISQEIATQHEIAKHDTKFWMLQQIFIHIPMMIIVLFCVQITSCVILYFISYFITLFYKCFIYYFTYYKSDEYEYEAKVNPIWWLFKTLFIIIICTVHIKSEVFIALSTSTFHLLLCCYINVTRNDLEWCDRLNLVLLCVINICFVVFSVQIASITFIVFGMIGTISILCIYICATNNLTEFKFSVLCLTEFFIHIPNTILLFYYMYENNGEFVELFYGIIGLYVFNVIYTTFMLGLDDDKSGYIVCSVLVISKLVIAVIFSIVYFNDIQDCKGLFAVSIIFISLSTCILFPIAWFCCYKLYFVSLEISQNGLFFGL
eukprot:192206_1